MTVNDELRPTGETHPRLRSETGDLWVRGNGGEPPPPTPPELVQSHTSQSTTQLHFKTIVLEEGNLPSVLLLSALSEHSRLLDVLITSDETIEVFVSKRGGGGGKSSV